MALVYCSTCGKALSDADPFCVACGAANKALVVSVAAPSDLPPLFNTPQSGDRQPSRRTSSEKSRTTAAWLCFLFGGIGAHRFYVGKPVSAILQIITAGGLLVWTIVDLVRILRGTFEDSEGLRLASPGSPTRPNESISARRAGSPAPWLVGIVAVVVAAIGGYQYLNMSAQNGNPTTDKGRPENSIRTASAANSASPSHSPEMRSPVNSRSDLSDLDFSGLTDQSEDTSSPGFVAYATSVDEWSRFDYFVLQTVMDAVSSSQTFAMLGDPQGAKLWLHQQTSYVYDASKVIEEHPDWSADDIYQEVSQSFALGRVVDREMIDYLKNNQLGAAIVTARTEALTEAFARCIAEVANIPPTSRPNSPDAACRRAILSRGALGGSSVAGATAAISAFNRSKKTRVVDGPVLEYPPMARRAGMEGEVVLEMCIDPSGHPLSLVVASSTGFDALDDAAEAWAKASTWEVPPNATTEADRCGLTSRLDFTLRK